MQWQMPVWATAAMALLATLITAWASRYGPRLTRTSDVEKQYIEVMKLDRQEIKQLKDEKRTIEELLDKERDEYREHLQEVRDHCNAETDLLRAKIQELNIQVVMQSGCKVQLDLANERIGTLERQIRLLQPPTKDDSDTIR